MKKIVVFGAGKSATCLIDFLIKTCEENSWHVTVVDGNAALAASKTNNSPFATPLGMNVEEAKQRQPLIEQADIVISLLPPALHILIAKDCVQYGKNLLTASYTDDAIRELQPEIERKELLFLCEMGLDPGIDHMSAMQLIHRIKNFGGQITSFKSHCGGLVAPESDNNPWHYKISWNPRNIVMAGKSGAKYRENGEEKILPYEEIFSSERKVSIPELGKLSWYPNRDSLSYIPLYGLDDISTFIRTTLRHPDFCSGWKNLVELQLTNEEPRYNTDGMTLDAFFHDYFDRCHLKEWVENKLKSSAEQISDLMEKLPKALLPEVDSEEDWEEEDYDDEDYGEEEEEEEESEGLKKLREIDDKAIAFQDKVIALQDKVIQLLELCLQQKIEEEGDLENNDDEEEDFEDGEEEYSDDDDERDLPKEMMLINDAGLLTGVNVPTVYKIYKVARQKSDEMVNFMEQLFFLAENNKNLINQGFCSAADVLQFALEQELVLQSDDKDMIVMLHEIEYENQNQKSTIKSSLLVKGENNIHTAMAKTVGLPLGIAAKLILEGKITTKGLHIPIIPEIYEPVLKELEKEGIAFNESLS